MRKSFHEQLMEAETRCVEMAGLILKQLEAVMIALESRDEALADTVIAGDDPIDELFIEIEERILALLATQAPVASDLRLVAAILHINIHLERMGDLCTNIAKFVRLTRDFPSNHEVLVELTEMGTIAGRMIDTAIRSFSTRDLDLALSLPQMDEPVNRLNRRVLREVVAVAHDEVMVEWAMRMILVSRYLERLGDQAVDVGEQVSFLITGEFRQFTDASHKSDA